jgi:hypothetical protein
VRLPDLVLKLRDGSENIHHKHVAYNKKQIHSVFLFVRLYDNKLFAKSAIKA